MNIFVFDIETIPDTVAGARLLDLDDLAPADIAEAMFATRREQTNGSDFLPHYLQRVIAISVVLRSQDQLKVWSLGDTDSTEAELIQRFYSGIERYSPTLVTWNGGGFDLPVLHYRSLLHGIAAPRYWEFGESDQSFKWNNYLNRFHYRHTDLMDVLAGYQNRASAPLDKIATLLGFPGKMGMDGSQVWNTYLNGDIKSIRDYCETDVLNTYLVYLRFELIRGHLSLERYQQELDKLANYLREQNQIHFNEFLDQWQKASS